MCSRACVCVCVPLVHIHKAAYVICYIRHMHVRAAQYYEYIALDAKRRQQSRHNYWERETGKCIYIDVVKWRMHTCAVITSCLQSHRRAASLEYLIVLHILSFCRECCRLLGSTPAAGQAVL